MWRNEGALFWKGEKVRARTVLRHTGAVLQDPSAYFVCGTVLDELVQGRRTRTPADVRAALEATGLTSISLVGDPRALSGGQTRRLAVAVQLLKEPTPELLVLDEPLAGVDWAGQREMVQFFADVGKRFTVLLVSHEPGELLEAADRVVEVRGGRVCEVGREVVRRAVETRERLREERRERVMEEARRYAEREQERGAGGRGGGGGGGGGGDEVGGGSTSDAN